MPISADTESKIKEIQKNYNYPGLETLVKLVKEAHPEIPRYAVKEFLVKDTGSQLTKVQRQKHPGGHITALSPNESWQFDIFDLARYESKNDGYKYIFACVDVFTRKAYLQPMLKKDSESCTAALKEILQRSGKKPKSMLSDQDRAFFQGPFEKFTDKEGIMMNTNALHDHHALGIIDNYAKRLKGGLTKIFLREKSTRWVDILQQFVNVENKKGTKALGDVAPVDAEKPENKEAILKLNLEKNTFNKTVADLQEGDLVRKTLLKSGMTKGTDPRWSDEVFRVVGTHGLTIMLNDGSKLKRTDLLKVPSGTTYEGKNVIRAQKEANKKQLMKEKLRQHIKKKKKVKEPSPPPPVVKQTHPLTAYVKSYQAKTTPEERAAKERASQQKKAEAKAIADAKKEARLNKEVKAELAKQERIRKRAFK